MARFSDYLDQYPGVLPGDIKGPTLFEPPVDQGSFFQKFLALQANPNAALMQKMNLPDKLKQFMSVGGIQ
jgi:hypothetical protein